jgi:hypothetical protein
MFEAGFVDIEKLLNQLMKRIKIYPVVSRSKSHLQVPEGDMYCSHPRISAVM